MESKGSLPCSQNPTTGAYPEPDQSNPNPLLFPDYQVYYYPPMYSYAFKVTSFHQVSPAKPCMYLTAHHTCQKPLISSPKYLVRGTDQAAPHSAVSSTPLLSCPSWAQIFSSLSYSQTLSAYVPASVWQTKFHTYTKLHAELWFCIFLFFIQGN